MNTLETKKFKPIEGYDHYYISNDGVVLSIHGKTPKLLKLRKHRKGYLTADLFEAGSRRIIFVHRLVGKAFCEGYSSDKEINHKDGNKTNNHVDNLEWVTRSQNAQHAYDNGLRVAPYGEQQGLSKLKEEDVIFIRKNYDEMGRYQLAEQFGVSPQTVYDVARYQTWKHVT